ncbi:MAG: L,D-transpeptidase family protein [Gammaproteobacteria bacterium]|nr:L,D-transpeptidase family protein [Gammaproteobacteria bacterium]
MKISRVFAAFRGIRGLPAAAALAACLPVLPWHTGYGAAAELPDAIRFESELLRESGRLSFNGVRIAAPGLIVDLYATHAFAPRWALPGQAEALLEVISSVYYEGLRPVDYHRDRIARTQQSLDAGLELSSRGRAAYDMMLTDSLVRLVYHLRYGKANPGTPASAPDLALAVQQLLDADSLSAAMTSVTPRSPHYQRLRAQLLRYRILAESGGWPRIADGATLRPGDVDPRLVTVARRLVISGDLDAAGAALARAAYSEALQEAVRRFQHRHGLEEDALIGAATLRALNVSVERRIDQIRVNLDRARWLAAGDSDDMLLVNIPGFRAAIIRDGKTVWTTKVVVGERETQTPEFRSDLRHVVFNPTWTVPYSIAAEELLPKIKQDRHFLDRGGYEVLDPAGEKIDPASIDWSKIVKENFRFTLVQRPGPANQLGEIKFIFPNEYSICMHDTPAKELFKKAERAFSHGCVRVDKPLAFAERVLDKEGWTRQQIDAGVRSRKTQTVALSEPLPVFVVYWTTAVDDLGIIHFYEDIYARDAGVLDAINAPVVDITTGPIAR